MKYIDTHCHLDFPDYDADRQEVLARMKEEGVGAITIGADLESSKRAVEIAAPTHKVGGPTESVGQANENVWACIGVHPEEVSKGTFDTSEFEKLVKSPKVVGIGECGLDYFRLKNESEKINQKKLFESQIQFAIKHDKPLMLHIRDARPTESFRQAYSDALNILKNYPGVRGNVHFFAGDIVVAKKILDLGFTMSFTGVITFLPRRSFAKAGTHDYDEVIKYIPQNSIMSETDAPFVAPVPYRGKRNEPVYVIEVVKKLAEIRGEDLNILNNAILQNFKRVFLRKTK